MTRITISKYKNASGEDEYQAFHNWEPICKNSTDQQFVTMFANSYYHQQNKAVLTFYDSKNDRETILEVNGYTERDMKKFELAGN